MAVSGGLSLVPGFRSRFPARSISTAGATYELDFKDRKLGSNNYGLAIFAHCYMDGQGFYSCNAAIHKKGFGDIC
jgi:hypothetical protein